MKILTAAQRRALSARAHHLDPLVRISSKGVTPSVLAEIDRSLSAHELLKIRLFEDDRERREAMLSEICTALDAAPVQHIGKLLLIWRENPAESATAEAAATPRRRSSPRLTKKAAAAKQERRRRS